MNDLRGAVRQLNDQLDVGADAVDYVGKIAAKLGIENPADVRAGKYRLERVGEAILAEIERLKDS